CASMCPAVSDKRLAFSLQQGEWRRFFSSWPRPAEPLAGNPQRLLLGFCAAGGMGASDLRARRDIICLAVKHLAESVRREPQRPPLHLELPLAVLFGLHKCEVVGYRYQVVGNRGTMQSESLPPTTHYLPPKLTPPALPRR